MKTKITLLAALVLVGCSNAPVIGGAADLNRGISPVSGKDLEKPKESVDLDPKLLEACKPLGQIKTNPLPSEVLAQREADLKAYSECAASKSKLVVIVKKAFNIK